MQKRQYLRALFGGIAVIAASVALFRVQPVVAQAQGSAAVFTSDGKLQIPKGFRRWVFVGAPLTPNGLNGGNANFPEFHNVYIQAQNVEAYMKTGEFPEGTVIVKELTRLLNPTFPDGSGIAPSGRGFFNGAFNGIDLSMKDSKRFAKTNGWGFFSFGHHAEPYEATSEEKSVAECAGCHIANVAKTDMTYIQFYPLLHERTGQTGWDTPQSR